VESRQAVEDKQDLEGMAEAGHKPAEEGIVIDRNNLCWFDEKDRLDWEKEL
jgi:hypothetical protein